MKIDLDLYDVFNLNFCKERPTQFIQERGKVNSLQVLIYHLKNTVKSKIKKKHRCRSSKKA